MAKKTIEKLEWKTVKRKVKVLVPLDINPRKISPERQQKLIESLNKFNLAEIPIINFDNTLIGGNQRCKVMQLLGRGNETIDVRYPNRQLTEHELKEYALTSNSHAGEWDLEALELNFSEFNLEDFDINLEALNETDEEDQGGNEGGSPRPGPPPNEEKRWFVYIDCLTEKEANKMYNELVKRGFETKVVN